MPAPSQARWVRSRGTARSRICGQSAFRDHAKTTPLAPVALFWIAPMPKPVPSVAAMILVEDGRLDLAAPVHQYLPEFKDLMVVVETTNPTTGQSKFALEPQKRPMTVEDLLR